MRRFVITGCGRSGTEYTARLLTRLGVPCGHEVLFNPHTRTGRVEFGDVPGDSSWLAAPFLHELGPDVAILHQVRQPLRMVRSWAGIGFFDDGPGFRRKYRSENWRFTRARVQNRLRRRQVPLYSPTDFRRFLEVHSPESFVPKLVPDRVLAHWVTWNERIDSAVEAHPGPTLTYRLETLDADMVRNLLDLIEVQPPESTVAEALAEVSRSTNARTPDETIDWSSFTDQAYIQRSKELAGRYGYGEVGGGGGT